MTSWESQPLVSRGLAPSAIILCTVLYFSVLYCTVILIPCIHYISCTLDFQSQSRSYGHFQKAFDKFEHCGGLDEDDNIRLTQLELFVNGAPSQAIVINC